MIFAILWLAWVAAFLTIELIAVFNKQKDDTLTEKIRDLFHTNTALGKTVWIIAMGAGGALVIAHILGVLSWWQ